jgi:hypothetical protein
MKPKLFAVIVTAVLIGCPLFAQEKIYPVRPKVMDVSVLINADRTAFVAERGFQSKLTIGVPDDDRMEILPDTRAPIVVLWLRIQNVSQRPLQVDAAKFTSTDDQGRAYTALSPDEAFNRMMADASDSIGSKTLRRLSLGKAAGKRTEEDVKEDIVRYSIHSGEIPAGGVREGMIYFEAPRRNKFTTNITLGDLWSKPLLFSTEKQK